jgi:hypothetical protein
MAIDTASYKVLGKSQVTLNLGGNSWVKGWTPPENMNFGTSTILAFSVNPSRGTGGLKLEIKVNGSVEKSMLFVTDSARGLWEALPAKALGSGDNEFRFTVTEGSGNLVIKDVVLWFKKSFTKL